VRIRVDEDVCKRHGQCTFVAPNVFQLDANAHLNYDSAPDESDRESIQDAVDVCPEQSITILD
jgi:ferredoxin